MNFIRTVRGVEFHFLFWTGQLGRHRWEFTRRAKGMTSSHAERTEGPISYLPKARAQRMRSALGNGLALSLRSTSACGSVVRGFSSR